MSYLGIYLDYAYRDGILSLQACVADLVVMGKGLSLAALQRRHNQNSERVIEPLTTRL